MPCDIVVVSGSGEPDIILENETINAGQNVIEMSTDVRNRGNAQGTINIGFSVDIGNNGTVDNEQTRSSTLNPGESEEIMVQFGFDFIEDKQVNACIQEI